MKYVKNVTSIQLINGIFLFLKMKALLKSKLKMVAFYSVWGE